MTAPAPFRLLFVCTGNTCRSPLAEAIARREASARGWTDFEVASAGVAAFPGEPASSGSMRAAERHGLDLSSHAATRLDPDVVAKADLVLGMSVGHVVQAIDLGADGRAALLTAFAAHGTEGDALSGAPVPDPFGGPDEAYEDAWVALDGFVTDVMNRLAPLIET